ncbi:ABC transporter substrate-binding protein [Paenibacillus doosanensis]|uniref:ABC transporter substrate-binding protein n=1 Tax=Paenibacillus doosanensis TaxID=1229154 RepID=UPI0021808DFC|nr:ABC transporter substrate-binding protein [Paenibacillus doosanensis]MCS7461921.1 ABC transporter substrate-binding protein [Paenibacillus doosanensis]
MKKAGLTILSLVIAGMLTACGGQGAAKQDAANTQGSSAPAAEKTAQSGANAKIASMSIHITNNLLALGITPIGSVIGGDVKDFLPHVKDRLQGVAKYGVVTDPDMEAVLASKPDVIYLDEVYSGKDISKFQKIAPTETIDMDQGTWRDHLKRIATKVGREKEADAFIQDYETKAKKVEGIIKKELGENAKVMAIRTTAKELRVMGMKRPLGPIMFEDLKLKPADGVEKIVNDPYQVISQEVLPDFNADAIFVIVSTGDEAKKNFDMLKTNPVWQNLKAVKNNHVYVLDGQKWLDYSSLGHSMALDDAEKLFTK